MAAEARKSLPAQPEDRGDLMPLHVASVLSWLCSDATTRSRLGTAKRGCYQLLWPLVPTCVTALQEKAPAAQNVTSGGRLDVVSFRAALRQCLAQQYAEEQQARGITTLSIEQGEPDPLAPFMSGKATSDSGAGSLTSE